MRKIFAATIILGMASVCAAQDAVTNSDIQQQIEELQQLHINSGPEFRMVGKVSSVGDHYAINNEEFALDENVVIEGDFHSGVTAEVSGPFDQGQQKKADHIIVAAPESTSTDSTIHDGPPSKAEAAN